VDHRGASQGGPAERRHHVDRIVGHPDHRRRRGDTVKLLFDLLGSTRASGYRAATPLPENDLHTFSITINYEDPESGQEKVRWVNCVDWEGLCCLNVVRKGDRLSPRLIPGAGFGQAERRSGRLQELRRHGPQRREAPARARGAVEPRRSPSRPGPPRGRGPAARARRGDRPCGVLGRERTLYQFESFTVPATIFRYETASRKTEIWASSQVPFRSADFAVEQV